MNTFTKSISMACLTLVLSSAFAQVKPDQPAAATQPAPTAAQDAAAMQEMQANMKTMRELMTRMQETTDPAARRGLMQQHLQLMHAQMQLMHGMGPMGSQCGAMMGSKAMTHHPMMQDRMNMMQMMMDQMMRREDLSESEKPAQ